MDYNLINANYKYDQLATAIQSRQLEHFHYNLDRVNFIEMLTQDLSADYRSNIEKRLADTISRMAEVESIYQALNTQIDDQTAYDAAVARLTV
jgi:hypothetical protein